MSLEPLLDAYGYPALFVGTLLEGETPLLMAGFLAHQGYLRLPLVVAVAFLGAFSADELLFHLGRTRGRSLLERHPGWRGRAARVESLLRRRGALSWVVSRRRR